MTKESDVTERHMALDEELLAQIHSLKPIDSNLYFTHGRGFFTVPKDIFRFNVVIRTRDTVRHLQCHACPGEHYSYDVDNGTFIGISVRGSMSYESNDSEYHGNLIIVSF